MRISFFALFLLHFSAAVLAAEELVVPSKIEKVTVFLNRAQVFRTSSIAFPSGQVEFVMEELSPFLDPSSIQVKGRGNFIILDVVHQVDYRQPEPTREPEEIQRLNRKIRTCEDSIRIMGYSLELVQNRRQALAQEKNVLLTNPIITNVRGSDTLPVLRDALLFLRGKLENIHIAMTEAHQEEDQLNAMRAKIQDRFNSLVQYRSTLIYAPDQQPRPVQQVRVTVYSKQAGSGKLEFNYTVGGASWNPAYDIRSAGPEKPVQLTYKALVRQQTGEDWDGIPLTLSTHDPSLMQEKPVLPIWYATYFQEVQILAPAMQMESDKSRAESLSYAGAYSDDSNLDIAAQMAVDYTSLAQTFANVEFTIDLGYEIPSDGLDHLILVQEKELAATYRHFLIPKLESESFIQARITGWEDLNLIPGMASLFYDGTFIGRAHVDPRVFGDTLNLPMGRDRMVYAERKRLGSDEKNKVLSGERSRTEKWTIEVRNNYPKAIDIVVQDQIPVAGDPTIKIALIDGNPDRYSDADGMLEWDITVNPGTRKNWTFTYEVQWDKNRQLVLR